MLLHDIDIFSEQFQHGQIPKVGRITKWAFCVIRGKIGLVIFT